MTSDAFVLFAIVWVLFTTVIGGVIGQSKGRTFAGAIWGFFLNILGIIIIAVMPPTAAKQAQRDEEQAERFWRAGPRAGMSASSGATPGEIRQQAIAEALRRDPTLSADQTPETIMRLAESIKALEPELALRAERDALMQSQEEEAQRAERARQYQELEEQQRQAREQFVARRNAWFKANRMRVLSGMFAAALLAVGATFAFWQHDASFRNARFEVTALRFGQGCDELILIMDAVNVSDEVWDAIDAAADSDPLRFPVDLSMEFGLSTDSVEDAIAGGGDSTSLDAEYLDSQAIFVHGSRTARQLSVGVDWSHIGPGFSSSGYADYIAVTGPHVFTSGGAKYATCSPS